MNFLKKNKQSIIGTTAALLIGGIAMSFQDTPFSHIQQYQPLVEDTFPVKKRSTGDEMTMKEFEKLPEKIDNEVMKAMEEIKKIDWTAIELQVKNALKEIDSDKIKAQVDAALKGIDFARISQDVTASLKDVEWEKMNGEIKEALEEAKKEIKEIDKDQIQKELNEARVEIHKSKEELNNIDLKKIMAEAKAGIETAKIELKRTKAMFDEMQNDGLINKKDGFDIEYKDQELYINDKKQSKEVTDKYRPYFKDEHFKMKISKEKE